MDDHISKALARAQQDKPSVRDWVKPDAKARRDQPPTSAVEVNELGIEIDLDIDHLAAGNVLCEREDPMVADRYRLLRTRVRQSMKPRGWTKLGITSPASKEGKSLTSLNLAITTARNTSGQVVLIDADLRRPSIANYLGIEPEGDLAAYLHEKAELEDTVYRSKMIPNLNIVPAIIRDYTEASHDSLGSERMQALLDTFTSENTMIIVDLPPVLVADDVLALAPLLDALLIVIREGQTTSDDLKQGTELLSGFNLLGTVLNGSKDATRGISGYYYADSAR